MAKHSETGRGRMVLLVSVLGGGSCALAMAAVLVFYGPPYDSLWWFVMAAILLVVTFLVPRMVAPAIEWVIDGYRQENAQ